MNRPRAEPTRRDGYISLLAISLTVGLAIFAGAISTGTVAYIRATADEARNIRDRIGLESAVASVLGPAADGEPVQMKSRVTISGRVYEVSVSPTSRKIDLLADTNEAVAEEAARSGLTLDAAARRASPGLTDLSRTLRLDASAEDCLRSGFTYGRGGQPRGEGVLPAALTVQPGDQLDVRVAPAERPGVVLWVRARITPQGWGLHDYRRLQGVNPCAAYMPSSSH